GAGEPALERLLQGGHRPHPGGLARGGGTRRRHGRAHARLLLGAGLLRRLSPGARAGQPDSGPARLLRRPHLQANRRRGFVPHTLVGGRRRSPDLKFGFAEFRLVFATQTQPKLCNWHRISRATSSRGRPSLATTTSAGTAVSSSA